MFPSPQHQSGKTGERIALTLAAAPNAERRQTLHAPTLAKAHGLHSILIALLSPSLIGIFRRPRYKFPDDYDRISDGKHAPSNLML
jgi:hypothetical protein